MNKDDSVQPNSETDSDEKTLVFFSASHEDHSNWYSRFKAKLDEVGVRVINTEFDTTFLSGDDWPDERKLEINQARIAVILLSPEYIRSEFYKVELQRLAELEKSGLQLFPIVLHQCSWQKLKLLKKKKVWSEGKPIDELNDNAADNELNKIAASIVELVRREPKHQSGVPATRFLYSPAAEALLKQARDIAKQSERDGVSSSCLLFAFAESTDNREKTVQFVRNVLKSTKEYSEVFRQFSNEADDRKGRGTHDGGELLGRISRNTLELLKFAEEIALRVSGLRTIYQRHLFAALLTTPKLSTFALIRLKALDIDLLTLRQEFRDFIHRQIGSRENGAEWDTILGSGDVPLQTQSPDTGKPLLPGEKSLHELLLSTDFGVAMEAGDRRAFRIGAVLALDKGEPMRSVDVLHGYLLDWSLDDGSAEAAFAVIVWFCLKGEQQEEVNFWKALGLENERDRMMASIKNPEAGDDWKISEELVTLALRSLRLAQATRPGEPVCTRHLLTCLIGQTGEEIDPTALSDLVRFGIGVSDVRAMFRDWLAIERKSEPAQPLDEALGVTAEQAKGRWNAGFRPRLAKELVPEMPRTPFVAGTAGYTSEFCGVGGSGTVPDHLGVEAMAQRLAELIANRDTKLPLAVGLFGNWGSGKSHFMNLMDRIIKKLAQETPEDWPRRATGQGTTLRPDLITEGPWCREIVPIYFNAWHYVDTNLWASLVSQIFDSLFAHLRPKSNDLEEVQKLLEQASGATARAAEELLLAQAATKKAKTDLDSAEETRLSKETIIDGLLHGLRKLLPDVTPDELKQEVIGLLGAEKEVETLDELRGVLKDARSQGGRVRILWNNVFKSQGREWRIMYLVGAVVIIPTLAYFGVGFIPHIKEWSHGFGQGITSFLVGVAAFLRWIRPIRTEFNRRLKQMEKWAKKAETAHGSARKTPEYKQAKMDMDTAAAREETVKTRLTEVKARERQLREEELSLLPERRLGRFIEQRAQSLDYRGQLGLVSLARRDFQELSDIFADAVALKEKLGKFQASKEAEKIEKLSKSIDRIVLFVDDLDRCQPEKVVDVLQAVHLLLAFPLFAVVVGVDQRCLRQSLRMQFKGLLTPDLETGQRNGQGSTLDIDENERPATPLDYLEKIFHIPFHLPPMGKEGFETLIEKLSEPPIHQPKQEPNVSQSKTPNVDKTAASKEPAKTLDESHSSVGTEATPAAATNEDKHSTETTPEASTDMTNREANMNADDTLSPPIQVIGSVPLEDWECAALKDYHMLIHTPRGATRLLNTYRLVRAGVPAEEWSAFCGNKAESGEFRLAMLLLASAAGYPALAQVWFDRLRSVDPVVPVPSGEPEKPNSHTQAWAQFKKIYDDTCEKTEAPLTKKLLGKWLDRVERFTF